MNITSPSSSHTVDIDNSDLVIAGNAQDILALAGSDGMFSVTTFMSFIVLSSGSSDVVLLLVCFLFSKGTSHIV